MLAQGHRAWLETERGIDLDVADRIGVETRGPRIGFPSQTPDGKLVAWKLLLPGGDKSRKWTTETISDAPALFNGAAIADKAVAEAGEALVITEGELDCLTALAAGYVAVSGTKGAATSASDARLDPFRAEAMQHWQTIILATDGDEKGVAYREVLAGLFDEARCKFVQYPEGCKDLNEVRVKLGPDAVRACLDGARPYPLAGVFTLDDYPEAEIEAYRMEMPGLDDLYRPFRGGMTVVAGVSSHGKSTWLTGVVCDLVCRGMRACVASFEEPVKPFYRDRLRRYWHGRSKRVRSIKRSHEAGFQNLKVTMSDEDRRAADQWIRDGFVFMDRTASEDGELPTIPWLLEMADKALMRHGYDVLVVDPWNKIDFDGGRDPIRAERQALNALKSFARRRNIMLFVVTHPNRGVYNPAKGETREPTMADISGGGHWEGMADHVVIVHRKDRLTSRTSIKIDKVKWHGTGRLGTMDMIYNRNAEYFFSAPAAPDEAAAVHGTMPDGIGQADPFDRGPTVPPFVSDIVEF
jgi:twinkle protein